MGISTLVIILANKKISNYINKVKEDRSHQFRQKNYFYQLCYDFAYGKDIRLYDLKKPLINDYRKKSYGFTSVLKRIYNKEFSLGMFELLMILLQDGVSYFLIIYSYYNNKISLGDASLYLLVVISLSQSIRELVTNITLANSNLNYSSAFFDFLDDKSYYSQKGDRLAFPKDTPLEIEFKDVSFSYPNTTSLVLDKVSFKINKGDKIAIVGINGAGKTTIVKLISGLLFPNSGEILINNINTKEFNKDEYNKMFATVFQDVLIYAASVYENVGGENYDTKLVELCLEKVGLGDKIKSLKNGYDTSLLKVIDNDGVELSGGETQKLSIARALYKDANCIILDEPTSALDALAEASIYQSFNDLVQNKTAVYISHRLSSTKFCDNILLFDKSGLKEQGTHDTLMELKGKYYEMFVVQGKYYQEDQDNV
jgi:ATP-binding cassette subfamily B protein/ATP-binding cassette subfamily C protein